VRRDITIKGASFTGTSDLTIVAPIRKGFVPALDAVTYKTRVKRVLKALHLGRQTAHEYEFARILSDAVERVGRIHSIRIAILEPEDKVVLAVTFDGSWESYIRVIWQKVSRSLDLIFCNTEGYVTGWDHTFDEWCAWLRKSQAESSFLYSPPGLTYQDTQYLRMYERRLRGTGDLNLPDGPGDADLATTRIRIPSAEAISDQLCLDGTDPTNLGLDEPLDDEQTGIPAFRQGMRSLAGLYRLAEVHLPATADGNILHRAASELLREFLPMVNTPSGRAKYQDAITFAEFRFRDALNWLCNTPAADRPIPHLPSVPDESGFADVQGGIVHGYPDVSDGCLLLLAFDAPQDLGEFLSEVPPTPATATLGKDEIAVNIALTLQGLRLAGLTDDEIAALPEEFVQGMERRAGMLGDVRVNHPRRWRLPALNWTQGVDAADVAEDDPCPRADLGSVHLVLQLRMCNSQLPQADARARLLAKYASLVDDIAAPRPLSIQWMGRLPADAGKTREHFGFLDGQSQPVLKSADAGRKFANQVHLGEILLGHANAADTAPRPEDCSEMQRLLRNGSFLVVRKLRQDVGAFEQALEAAVRETTPDGAPAGAPEAQRQLLLAKMVGRWPIGHPDAGKALANATPGNDNDFSFDMDADGARCPFHAHIRRANPRDNTPPEPPGARPARLIRRGMPYGPLHDPAIVDDAARAKSLARERGLVFMAYNASIGEQFEVVQRWLTGGNSSGSYSGQSDPLLGIAEPGRPRYFRFEHDNAPVRMRLDGSNRMHDEPRPFVRLEWGMYLLAPALSALQTLAARALQSGWTFAKSWSEEQGEREIARLRHIEITQGEAAAFDAWKAVLEDPASASDFTAASVWAAIRKNHGGALATPFGVLVASRALVDQVLQDRARNLTATGYLPRMQRSFGPLYLGMDAGQIDGAYELESVDVNAAIMNLVAGADFAKAVAEAATVTGQVLQAFADKTAAQAAKQCESRWEVSFEAREVIDAVLAHFCKTWFGLSDTGGYLQKSGMRWNWTRGEPPCYPGHFMAPSRYTFQPHPGPEVERIGAEHGVALRVAITKYLAAYGAGLTQPVAVAALNCEAARRDPTYPARTLAGVLMGFLPTTDGNMRRVLNEWLNEGTLWALRAQYRTTAPDDAPAQRALTMRLRKKFVEAMQLRAAPELLWRTAATSHLIGKPGPDQVEVRAGEIVIASLISATHECLEQGNPSLDYAFGGKRDSSAAQPTHACPGYGPATAVMFGFFEGLVKSGLALRPGPAPLSFSMEGHQDLPESCTQKLAERRSARPAAFGPGLRPVSRGIEPLGLQAAALAQVELMMIGDSWLTRIIFNLAYSLCTELEQLQYTSRRKNFSKIGQTLVEMCQPVKLAEIRTYLANVGGEQYAPKAILIGGGGNDLVDPPGTPDKTRLYDMLVENAASAQAALVEEKVKKFIDDDLKGYYRKILAVVTDGTSVPILIHAYDHPIPDGTPSNVGHAGPWLEPVFKARNIELPVGTEVMRTLIDRLNAMVASVALEFPGRVHPLNLNGTLAKEGDYAANYKKYWANELHATNAGFDVLAGVVRDKLVSLGVR
jgi:Dyp-type peroxidase family